MRTYNYTELIAWQRAMDLAVAVYEASSGLPLEERFGLTAQMRRAATSVAANIAEGQGRATRGEFRNLLSVAYGSLCEMETHILLSQRLGLIRPEVAASLRAIRGSGPADQRPGKIAAPRA
jgi:four helix bundle protein